MDMIEIVLLIAGGIIFILSFLLPAKKDKKGFEGSEKTMQEEIRRLVEQELKAVRDHVDDVVDEAVGYAVEKTERSLERISNEKIMAVNEYSDTVLAEIHRNHEEAMFLYDMLNDKHTSLKNTVSEINRTVKEAEKTVDTFQKLAPDAVGAPQPAPGTAETGEQRPASAETGAAFQRLAPEVVQPSRSGAAVQASAAGAMMPLSASAAAEAAGPAESGREEAVGSAAEPERAGRNKNERILELYRQGKSKVEIAKQLDLGVGEVKLVLDLFWKLQREEEAE